MPNNAFLRSPMQKASDAVVLTLVASAIDASADGHTAITSEINTTSCNLLVTVGSAHTTLDAPSSPSDNKSNVWTLGVVDPLQEGGSPCIRIWYCESPTVGSGHTFALSGTSCFPSIAVLAFSGIESSAAFDDSNISGLVTNGPPAATGSVTPSESNEVLIYALGTNGTDTISVDIGTMLFQLPLVGGAAYSLAVAYQIQGAAVTRNPSFSWASGGLNVMAAIATFKASNGV